MLLLDALVVFWLAGGISRYDPATPGRSSLRPCDRVRIVQRRISILRCRRRRYRRSNDKPQPLPKPGVSAADDFAMKSTLETKLAYVITGDTETDAISKAGLSGLTLFLAQRTALEAGEPIGLDIARDELNFFPLIYWPIVRMRRSLRREALGAHRRLHETGRHRAVRHPRRDRWRRPAPAVNRAAPA